MTVLSFADSSIPFFLDQQNMFMLPIYGNIGGFCILVHWALGMVLGQ